MRPVNLIPLEQRRGTARFGGAKRSSMPVHVLLGALGAGVLCTLAVVLTGNQVSTKTEELAGLKAKEEGAKAVADALRPYGQFATVQNSREQQIAQLAEGRIDWEHALDQLSKATPHDVWLTSVEASLQPGLDTEGSGGDAGSLPGQTTAPTFSISGCAFSHRTAARMMVRMRNLDGVTHVSFSKSERKGDTSGGAAPAASSPAGASAGGGSSGGGGCGGSSRVTEFSIVVEFGGLQPSAAAPVAADAAGVPGSSAAPTAAAQTAAAQGSGSTAAPAEGGQ